MDENIFDKLRQLNGKFPEKLNILEQQIDVKLQMDYFKYTRKYKKQNPGYASVNFDELPDLNDPALTIEAKKEQLVKLASLDNAKAYRAIESFVENNDPELNNWAILALQESKMLIESNLLQENQIFISTGLGGKGNALRYFIVLIGNNITDFSDFQKNMIQSEFEFALKNNKSELESITFEESFALMLALIPFEIPFQKVFRVAVEECNQFGGFLKPNFLVTNVKTLSVTEIKEFLDKNDAPPTESIDDIEFDQIDDITNDDDDDDE